ncbi:MAG: NRDE family protein [Myxococcales bacterium]|nr:NRDE family protein [Myxococcales bacterium]
MCTLVVLHRAHPDWPVVCAANRDEYYARPTEPPQVLLERPHAVGGRDALAGGTWMGVTASGFFVGLTNQPPDGAPDPSRASRGQVVLDALAAGSTAAAEARLRGLRPGAHNPFNLVFGDADGLRVLYARDTGHAFADVPPGVHVLPNGRLNDAGFPKVQRARALLTPLPADGEALLTRLQRVLADGDRPADAPARPRDGLDAETRRALHALCVRTPAYGTRSASIVALRPGGVARYLHADGPPDRAPFVDRTALLAAR